MQWRTIFLLIVLFLIYLLIGAVIFEVLERPSEESQCEEIQQGVLNVSQRLENSTITAEDIAYLARIMQFAASYGVHISDDLNVTCVVNWDLEGSFFFCGTVLTTIGYGHIAPVTYVGQTFCIIYAIIGIPLFGIMFTGIGEKIAGRVEKLESRIRGRTKRSWVRKSLLALIIVVTFTLLCFLIPATIFVHVEKWSYHDSFYYAFITLTTIGFGDYVAGVNPEIDYFPIYRSMVYFWILFGLAFAAVVIALLAELWMEASPERRRTKRTNKITPQSNDARSNGGVAESQRVDAGDPNYSEYDF